jgi:hypothetical protein
LQSDTISQDVPGSSDASVQSNKLNVGERLTEQVRLSCLVRLIITYTVLQVEAMVKTQKA